MDRLLDQPQWDRLRTGLSARFTDRDVRRSEVEAEYGPPSLVIDQRVLCYAPADSSGWVMVDCFDEPRTEYVPGAGHYRGQRGEDPLVRDVRVPAGDFENGLVLTLYGKVLRWGPGWWIHHRSEGASVETQAIAAQLRAVAADDPSQALKHS